MIEVGDLVKVVDTYNYPDDHYMGQVGRVTNICEDCVYPYDVRFLMSGDSELFNDNEIEVIVDEIET